MDDFCRAHQIPYDNECPECALLVIDNLANATWKADEWHTGDAPHMYVEGFRAAYNSVNALREEIEILKTSAVAERTLRNAVHRKWHYLDEALRKIVKSAESYRFEDAWSTIYKIATEALKK